MTATPRGIPILGISLLPFTPTLTPFNTVSSVLPPARSRSPTFSISLLPPFDGNPSTHLHGIVLQQHDVY